MRGLPIFITGFERSGTTLLRRLMSMHPDLKFDLLHEQRRLAEYMTSGMAEKSYIMKTKQEGKFLGSTASVLSGEKVPFIEAKFIIKYMKLWRRFWPASSILYVKRNMHDCAASAKRTFKKDVNNTLSNYRLQVPVVEDYLDTLENVCTIQFADILYDPYEFLAWVYGEILGYVPEKDFIYKVITTRHPWEYKGRIMCGLRYFDSIGGYK